MTRGLKIASFVFLLFIASVGFFLYFKAYFSPSYIHYRVGERLYREGKYEAALKEFEIAFKLDPYNRGARLKMAEIKELLKTHGRKAYKKSR
ncbi:MAG: hypothetical protein GXO44_04765 [Deferribacteres bacterium]|nr:hypothetical protein [Deferribacteres bacterium]